MGARLVMCLTNSWCFVAPKMARRGSISAEICDRGATKPQAIFGATLRAAVLLASRVVACSLQTSEGYARRSRLITFHFDCRRTSCASDFRRRQIQTRIAPLNGRSVGHRSSRLASSRRMELPRLGADNFPRRLLVSFLQFVYRLDHPWQIHRVHFEALADAFEQREGELAAEVFAKLFQPSQHHQIAFRIDIQ